MKVGNPEEQVRMRELGTKIRKLLAEYDVAGMVNLQGKDQAEYVFEVTPSWSCLTWEQHPQHGLGLRFKAKLKTGDDAEKERGRLTTGMICGFMDILAVQFRMLDQVKEMLSKHVEIEHVSQHALDQTPMKDPPLKGKDAAQPPTKHV